MRDTMLRYIVDDRRTNTSLEQTHRVVQVQADMSRDVFNRERLRVTLRDEACHLFHLGQLGTAGCRPVTHSTACGAVRG